MMKHFDTILMGLAALVIFASIFHWITNVKVIKIKESKAAQHKNIQRADSSSPFSPRKNQPEINENELAKQRSTQKNWSYQSDKRSFDRKPPDMTAQQEGWTQEEHDMMVLIQPKNGNLEPFYIDAFEAFISNYQAWSVPDVYPTDKIKYENAITACEAAGKRLCHVEEWRTACRGGYTAPVEFKNTNELLRLCDFARSSGYDRTDYVEKTDSHVACTAPGLPVYHMIGNLAEFVYSPEGNVMTVGLTYYDGKIRDNPIALKRACERTVINNYSAARYNKGTGFRCCKDSR